MPQIKNLTAYLEKLKEQVAIHGSEGVTPVNYPKLLLFGFKSSEDEWLIGFSKVDDAVVSLVRAQLIESKGEEEVRKYYEPLNVPAEDKAELFSLLVQLAMSEGVVLHRAKLKGLESLLHPQDEDDLTV